MVTEPDEKGGQSKVPGQLVEEGWLEGGELRVAGRAMRRGDLKAPGKVGWTAEELLVEVIADPPDRLADQERRRGCIEKARD